MSRDSAAVIIKEIKDTDQIQIFYKDYDTHTFACSFLFYKYFREKGYLDNVVILPVEGVIDRVKDKTAITILIDIEITAIVLNELLEHSKRIIIIDQKENTVKHLKTKSNKNLSLITQEGYSPIHCVWDLLYLDINPDNYILDLDTSYCNEHVYNEGNNKISILKNIPKVHAIWYEYVNSDDYKELDFHGYLNTIDMMNSMSIAKRNTNAFLYNGHKVLFTNCTRENMDTVGILTCQVCDFSVMYEKCDNYYYYRVYMKEGINLNLLDIFSRFNCVGFRNRVWFRTTISDFIFNMKKSFMARLLEIVT